MEGSEKYGLERKGSENERGSYRAACLPLAGGDALRQPPEPWFSKPAVRRNEWILFKGSSLKEGKVPHIILPPSEAQAALEGQLKDEILLLLLKACPFPGHPRANVGQNLCKFKTAVRKKNAHRIFTSFLGQAQPVPERLDLYQPPAEHWPSN